MTVSHDARFAKLARRASCSHSLIGTFGLFFGALRQAKVVP